MSTTKMSKKPLWLFRQSGAIPYIISGSIVKICLVTTKSSDAWVFPKGVIERDIEPEHSAKNEALEEAGVIGEVSNVLLDQYRYEKWGGTCEVKVYPLRVVEILEEWDEMNVRERQFVQLDIALHIIKQEQKMSLMKFKEFLSQYS